MKWKGFTPEEIVLLRNNPYTLKVTERTMLKKTVYACLRPPEAPLIYGKKNGYYHEDNLSVQALNDICAFFEADRSAVERNGIVVYCAPFSIGEQLIIDLAHLIFISDELFGIRHFIPIEFTDAGSAELQRRVNKDSQHILVIAQDKIGAAPYDDARPLAGKVANHFCLHLE